MANTLGALDFAGGTAVEINSGASALALALVLGKRSGWPREPMRPHNLPAVLLGAGLLWFGWFGFNAGSALAAGAVAANAFVTTMTASAAAVMAWLVARAPPRRAADQPGRGVRARSRAWSAITPACGFVDTCGALLIGVLAGVVCQLAIRLKYRLGYDDSLDVVAIHGVGGLVGMLMIGLRRHRRGQPRRRGRSALRRRPRLSSASRRSPCVVAAAFAFVRHALLAWIVRRTIGFRVERRGRVRGHRRGGARRDRVRVQYHRLHGGRASSGLLGATRPPEYRAESEELR